ncbi:MAG: PKD domain-containing protein [Candidatus Aenigmatarchaeota archaeon]
MASSSNWEIKTIDSDGVVGFPSLAIDSEGDPHISYSGNNYNLKYAEWLGWSWDKVIVNSNVDVIRGTEIDTDTNNNPHINYYTDMEEYKYSKWNGNSWDHAKINGGKGQDNIFSMVLDQEDRAHICYANWHFESSLAYSYWNGSSWEGSIIEPFDGITYCSIDVTSDNKPYVAIIRDGSVYFGEKLSLEDWSYKKVFSGSETNYANELSLVIDSDDNPHIAFTTYDSDHHYADSVNMSLKYTNKEGNIWQISTVDTGDYAKLSPSMDIDSNGNSHIAYIDGSDDDLKYAKWNSGTYFWNVETVDPDGYIGEQTSMDLDSNDNPYISYVDTGGGNLKLAIYNQLPTAQFTFSPTSPKVGEEVTFDASGSSDPDGSIEEYIWNFGDKTRVKNTSDSQISHTYSRTGTKIVELQVRDNSEVNDTITKEIEVLSETGDKPVAEFTHSPESPEVEEEVTFDASESYDPDGDIVEYRWDFDGDGANDLTASNPQISHTYSESGTYTVSLEIEDNEGNLDSESVDLLVEEGNKPPVADFSFDISNLSVNFTDKSSDDESIVSWEWDFNEDGEIDSTEQSPLHTYQFPGIYNVSLEVTDNQESLDVRYMEVSVEEGNKKPVASFSYNKTGLSVQFNDMSSDPNGFNDLSKWNWDFNEDNKIDSEKQNPLYTYSSDGTYTVELTVEDGEGLKNSVSKEVSVTKDIEGDTAPTSESDDTEGGDVAASEDDSTGETFSLSTFSRGKGSVNTEPSKSNYEEGEKVTLIAEPEPGYEFKEWVGDVSKDSKTIDVKMKSNMDIYAVFSKVEGEVETEQPETELRERTEKELPIVWLALSAAIIVIFILLFILYKKPDILRKGEDSEEE